MKFIFAIAAFNAFFFAVLLFQKKPKAIHDKILVFWLSYLGLFIGLYSIGSHNIFEHFQILSISLISLFLLHGVFLFFYVSSLVSYKFKFQKKDILHLTPFLFFNLYLIIISFFPAYSEGIRLDHIHSDIKPIFLFVLFLIITALSGPVYFVLSHWLMKKHDINIFNLFSFSEQVNLVWLRKLIYIFGIVWTVLIIVTVIHHVFNLFSMVFCTDGLFLALSIFVITIGYFGLKQKVIFDTELVRNQEYDPKPRIKYAGSRLSAEEANQYMQKIQNAMVSSKQYLKPDLTLHQLSSELKISVHDLSQVINEKFNLNFFDFVNHYRVEEVKSKISDPKFENYSLLGIALDSGFNSKSAFNRVFKKLTGLTPSEYKNQF